MQLTIGILAAMPQELEPFLSLGLGGDAEEILPGRPVYSKLISQGDMGQSALHVNLLLMICGIGKVRAASATQALIDHYHPDLILNIGTAGGLRPEIGIGDFVITVRQYQHDNQLWERYSCAADQRLSEWLHAALQAKHRVHLGNGCAGDTFQTEVAEKQRLARQFDALCVDMESAAIADTCQANRTPFCIIRTISDTLEGNDTEFELNYQQVSRSVALAVAPLLGGLARELRNDQRDIARNGAF